MGGSSFARRIARPKRRSAGSWKKRARGSDEAQRRALIEKAKTVLPPKIDHYAALMGVHPTRVTITSARTRFGSCSGRNAISFSWRLMQYPEEAIDYVVVHELAHIRHHDHSAAFYRFIASVMPDHEARRALLRQ